MKKRILERFLPMWAKNTVMKDLERAQARITALEQENRELRAYIKGLRHGTRRGEGKKEK